MVLTPYSTLRLKGIINHFDVLESLFNQKVIISARRVDKKVIIYGGGNLGEMARNFFEHVGIPISYLVDENAENIKLNSF